MQQKFSQIGLHIILSTDTLSPPALLKLAEITTKEGADSLQFRHKEFFNREMLSLCENIKCLTDRANIPLIINDHIDVALLLDAAGVHLGQEDLPISVAKEVLGPNKIIGGTASTMAEMKEMEKAKVDYIGFGHVFPTQTKKKLSLPVGLSLLREICHQAQLPIIAIGGINASNLDQIYQNGAQGAALISALSSLSSAEEQLTTFRQLLKIKNHYSEKQVLV